MTPRVKRWSVPSRNLFGSGAAAQTGRQLHNYDADRVLVVTDKGVRDAGVLDPVLESIEEAGGSYEVFDETVPDPTETVVEAAADAFTSFDAEMIVGVGGGSSIDTAKAASILTTNEGRIFDYSGIGNVPNPTPPSVYVPTTSGTGSEATHWSVITNEETHVKESIGDSKVLADVSIVDPSLTKSVPAPVKAATGMDALTHAIEAHVGVHSQSQTSALALDAVENIGQYLPRAVEYRGQDTEALTRMAKASNEAGMAFNGAGLGAVHALAHQIGGQFDVPHGLANAIVLPHVMEYNLPQVPEKMVDIAEALGVSVDHTKPARREGYKAVRAVRQLATDVRIPTALDEVGVEREAISSLAERALNDAALIGNPRTTNQNDMESILERAFDGTFEHEAKR